MKIKINDISEEGITLAESLNPQQMGLETPWIHFLSDVGLEAVFQKERETVWVEAKVSGRMEQTCGRCLEPYSGDYSEAFHLDYSTKDLLELDVTDDIRQEILLSYPVRLLCREDCKGLCPTCGNNLNERRCTHAPA